MNIKLLLLQGGAAAAGGHGDEPDAEPIVSEAARHVFSDFQLQGIKSVREAHAAARGLSHEFVVLVDPEDTELDAALAATDESGLPRWPVLGLGPDNENGEYVVVPRAEWSPRSVARGIRLALTHHAARRESARSRGDLSSIGHRLAHDLRAQLGGILSAAEVVREMLIEESAPNASLVQPIIESSETAAKLLERVSFVLRASANPRLEEPMSMETPFWGASQRLESQFIRKRALLIRPEAWPRVHGVNAWLEVVWWNLLTNALQHGGKELRVTVDWEQLGKEELRFWVNDNGPGVPPPRRAWLFHPLHRLHESSAPSGLGLPIVQRLVQLQGGRCGYEPIPEGGACFFFTLPVHPVPRAFRC